MKSPRSKTIGSNFSATIKMAAPVLAALLLAAVSPARADQGQDNRAPEVPAALQVPDGNKVEFHAYAVGVQIYIWSAASSTWVFRAPSAVLYASAEDHGEVAIHYAGPTWESDSGSKVVGAKIAGVTVDSSAIPWLLLKAKTTEGPGIFARTTYVQRVNTIGGLAPSTPGTVDGQEADVPYTAEYFFYRAQD